MRGSTVAVTFLPFTVMETGADIDEFSLDAAAQSMLRLGEGAARRAARNSAASVDP
ncbi:hypothetical protein GCM10011611_06280 [Aliidongia dinghuensis]|uniref:Uncharacterized protein n=1 Tax=Aliidongia dinghuensis TaxID=1867774 RepID=A0A8J2YPL3_9PROT|nr:hypothetical protein GCM10011611_06280 [Aliidongia dinghuensis]